MATIGELIISIRAGTASFVADLNRVKNLSFDTAAQISRSLSIIGTAGVGMLGAFAGAMAIAVDKTVAFETHILHLAASAGTSTETMSGLAFVAKMVGMNVDEVALAMERFDKKLLGMGTNKATADLMAQFGIKAGTFQTSEQALEKLADRFATMPAGIQKSGIAMQFFGKAGAAMIPILDQGSEGIQKFMAQAQALGVVVTEKSGLAAEHFEQDLRALTAMHEGLVHQIVDSVIPNLNALTDSFLKNAVGSKSNQQIIESATYSLRALASIVVFVIEEVTDIGAAFRELGSVVLLSVTGVVEGFMAMHHASLGNVNAARADVEQMKAMFQGIPRAIQDANRDIENAAKESKDRRNAIWGEGLAEPSAGVKALAGIVLPSTEAAAAQKKLEAAIKSVTDRLNEQVGTFGLTAREIEHWKLVELGATDAQIAALEPTEKMIDAKIREHQAWLAANDKVQAHTDLLRSNAAAMRADIDAVNAMLAAQPPPGAVPTGSLPFALTGKLPSDLSGAIEELNAKLKEQVATFGLDDSAMQLYNLTQQALRDGVDVTSEAFKRQITTVQMFQAQLGALDAAAKENAKAGAEMKNVWKSFGEVAYHALDDLIIKGKSFTQVLHDIFKQMEEMLLKGALFGFGEKNAKGGGGLFGMLAGLFTGGHGGGLFGGAAAPASGGASQVFAPQGGSGAGGIMGLITGISKAFFGAQSPGSAASSASSAGLVGDFSKAWFGTTSSASAASTASSGGLAGDFSSLWLGGQSGALGGSSGLGSLLGGLFSLLTPLGFAGGGSVAGDVPILVGENGPEIFNPSSAGTIIPNSAIGGGSSSGGGAGGVTYNIDARGADVGVETRIRAAIAASENRAVARALQMGREAQLRTPGG